MIADAEIAQVTTWGDQEHLDPMMQIEDGMTGFRIWKKGFLPWDDRWPGRQLW